MDRSLRIIGALACVALVSACATQHGGGPRFQVQGHYRAPGPPEDPWGPYIREASARYRVPEQWIREVMRQESGGHPYIGGELTT